MSLALATLLVAAAASLLFIGVLLGDGVRVLRTRLRQRSADRPIELRVAAREEVAGTLLRLSLRRAWGRRLPSFAAGQYLTLIAPAGPDCRELRRAYSLAAWQPGRPRHYELGIKREAHGALSRWAWAQLQPGARIRVLPPRGGFVLDAGAGELVLVGGGIGITPLRAMLHAALARRSGPARIVLFHAARRAEELLYRDEFMRLAAADDRLHYVAVVSRPDAAWKGVRGRLDATRLLAGVRAPGRADFYLCAGVALMETLREGLTAAGVEPGRIHWEAFGVAASAGGAGQRVSVGEAAAFETAGEPTLLAALEAHGRAPPTECRAGSCGLCRMRLTAGQVEWLLPAGCVLPADEILPCICRPVGDVSLV
ncbi:2Fe-2S iron-sulfur cluster-binding protein [Thauera chlorobenzoica]|uniref:Putative dioxygenase n=1 Tax=Thauera chlorobenzoica TaxID=96773 RepID=A0A1H5T6G0_9RHOO|nr:2Fe-2S iron-sulfur cluster-binding protein [Thauera chlorobenzoica]APR04215.1 putative dioxygenase [Thauera chlorobenzoica]SEF58376.1 hypothetical protein SAMN05216242_102245 [Thauera chlorobenzoica]